MESLRFREKLWTWGVLLVKRLRCTVNGAIVRAERRKSEAWVESAKESVHPTRTDPNSPVILFHRYYRAVYHFATKFIMSSVNRDMLNSFSIFYFSIFYFFKALFLILLKKCSLMRRFLSFQIGERWRSQSFGKCTDSLTNQFSNMFMVNLV